MHECVGGVVYVLVNWTETRWRYNNTCARVLCNSDTNTAAVFAATLTLQCIPLNTNQ